MMKLWIMGAAVAVTLAGTTAGAKTKRPMTTEDLLAVKTVADPQVSPDGKWVVYVVSEVDKEADKANSSLWLVRTSGGEPRRITSTPGTNNHPRWSPDGKTIAFVSSRGGSSQVWLLPIDDGGEARQLTKLPIDIDGPIWSPEGDRIAFVAHVYPGTTPDETAARDKARDEAKSKARVYDDLMVRHWTEWDSGKRSHLFVADAKTGEAVDLTPKLTVNTPPAPFGGSGDYAWSADGRSLAYTAEPIKDGAWSTNTDIWLVPAGGGEPDDLTAANPAADASPLFSPDGKRLAYLAQDRAGFEADLWVLRVRDLASGKTRDVARGLDRPIQSFAWKDAETLLATIDDGGNAPIVLLPINADGKKVERLATSGVNSGIMVGAGGGGFTYIHHSAAEPAEVYFWHNGQSMRLTSHNTPLLSQLDVNPMESFTFKGAGGDDVQGWLMKPPGFEAGKKYPVLFLIHGGPQGAWHDEWHARWNYGLFAAPGYALVAINPRGSTGFGQRFTDEISRDWTGKVYDDLMAGLDHALKTYDFLDESRVAAAGGSYGGFMVNWICGHTDRFKALISHAGVFDLVSMYGSTEELWFPDWEYGGPPWKETKHYLDRSPSLFADHFKTPTLVLHGAQDFRVPDAQGLGMFTSLRRVGVPARYVWFPDEGHWILKPANRIVWWREVHDWLAKYLK